MEPRKPIFDRAFDNKGDMEYYATLKNGMVVVFQRRSEIWKDKANNLFFTAYTVEIGDDPSGVIYDEVDIRFNDISLITECEAEEQEKVEFHTEGF